MADLQMREALMMGKASHEIYGGWPHGNGVLVCGTVCQSCQSFELALDVANPPHNPYCNFYRMGHEAVHPGPPLSRVVVVVKFPMGAPH